MNTKISKKPSPLACISCRTKHLKCDNLSPTCSRCDKDGMLCQYTKSRRGFRGLKQDGSTSLLRFTEERPVAPSTDDLLFNRRVGITETMTTHAQIYGSDSTVSTKNTNVNATSDSHSDAERLVDLYYRFVHPVHSFIIPRKLYVQDRTFLPGHLKNVMKLLGTHFEQRNNEYTLASEQTLSSIPEDGFKVQTLLLSALASFARFEQQQGTAFLYRAVALALSIGMDEDDFASGQTFIIRESWRRTWWELYTVTGTISVVIPLSLKLDIAWDLKLPICCDKYGACTEFPFRTLGQMHDSYFMEDNYEYSSFAYKVEATRILNNVLEINNDVDGASESQLAAVKASIASYMLRIPMSKRYATTASGDADEAMLFALVLVRVAEICLHLPRSGFSGLQNFRTSCWNSQATYAASDPHTHRIAALRSSNSLFQLMSENTAFVPRSPCFTCPITLATIVQLLSYLREQGNAKSQVFKEQIQLALSLLSRMGEYWPIAHAVKAQLAQFAREVLSRSGSRPELRHLEPAAAVREEDMAMFDEQWLRDIVAESSTFADVFDLSPTTLGTTD